MQPWRIRPRNGYDDGMNETAKSLSTALAAAAVLALLPQPSAAAPEGIAPAPGKTNDAKYSYYLGFGCYVGQVVHKLNSADQGEIIRDYVLTTHGIVDTVDDRKLRGLDPSMRQRFLRVLVAGWHMCQHRHVAAQDRADGNSVTVKDTSGHVVYQAKAELD
jgi:hypothetical protein